VGSLKIDAGQVLTGINMDPEMHSSLGVAAGGAVSDKRALYVVLQAF
jgi:hypothetical protein